MRRLKLQKWANMRAATKRWHRQSLILLGLSVLAILVYGANTLYQLPVSRIKVVGAEHSHVPDEIKSTLAPFLTKSFFSIDLSKAQENLQQIAWLNQVSLSRHWPSQLTIRIEEHRPLALWASGGIITETGELIDVDVEGVRIVFSGPVGQQGRVWQMYYSVQQALLPLSLQVASLTLEERGAWSLTLDNGMRLMLGRDEVGARLARFVTVFPTTLNTLSPHIQYVDMRYAQGFAVGWRTNTGS